MGQGGERHPRRTPRSRDSEADFDAIVEATANLLAAHGLVGVTTNRIAERAGVTTGMVHRYFADKESIIAEVARRLRNANEARLLATLARGGDFATMIHEVIEGFVWLDDDRDLAVRRVLQLEVPPSWIRSTADRIWASAEDAIAAVLRERIPALTDDEARRRTFVAMHAVEGVVRDAAIRLGDEELTAVVEELTTMVTRYLLRDPP